MTVELTVCLLTYNHVEFIGKALDSILCQKTSFDWIIKVHDDHSTDGTTEILKKYTEEYPGKIDLYVQPINLGAAENGKKLLLSASSKYVAFIEGDDYWIDDQKLQKQYNVLENEPSVGIVYAKALQIVPGCNRSKLIGKIADRKTLYLGNPIPTSTVVLRKDSLGDYFDVLGSQLRTWKMGDYPIWLWVASNWKLAFIDEPMSAYRVLETSATRSGSKSLWIKSKMEIIGYFHSKYPRGGNVYYMIAKIILLFELFYHNVKALFKKGFDRSSK